MTTPQSADVKQIASTFNSSFELFKSDKEVKNTMTIADKYRNEGWLEGREEGREEGALKIVELIKSGLTPEEALRKVNEECKSNALVISPA